MMHKFMGAAFALLALPALAAPVSAQEREFYIKTVHFDGRANIHGDASHGPETFPNTDIPAGGGLQLKKPNDKGAWKIRAFTFQPQQITVRQGDRVTLHFVGVQGMKHTIHVEGKDVDEKFVLARGKLKDVSFTAKTAGVIRIECYDHQPAMNAEIVVMAP